MGALDISSIAEGSTVTVDSAPIIYLLEAHPLFLPRFLPLFEQIDKGAVFAVISVITLAEVLAGPLKQGDEILANRYYRIFTSTPNWQVQNLDADLSFMAARIRIRYGLKLPDAIQVATAIFTKSTALITHDRDFSSVNEIRILGL